MFASVSVVATLSFCLRVIFAIATTLIIIITIPTIIKIRCFMVSAPNNSSLELFERGVDIATLSVDILWLFCMASVVIVVVSIVETTGVVPSDEFSETNPTGVLQKSNPAQQHANKLKPSTPVGVSKQKAGSTIPYCCATNTQKFSVSHIRLNFSPICAAGNSGTWNVWKV